MNLKDKMDSLARWIAVPAFLLSLWVITAPHFQRVKVTFVPERQLQLISSPGVLAFNMLVTITASGPSRKWETLKFEEATLRVPDGRTISFPCRAYLVDKGRGQRNQSRNIPVALQGGDTRIITPAFQSSDLEKWSLGSYELRIVASTSSGKRMSVSGLKFTLVPKDLEVIAKPDAIYMKPLDDESNVAN
jgi:hypothetical protein